MEELKTFNLLQIQMQKRAEELQKLRLDLLAPAAETGGARGDENDSEGGARGTQLAGPPSARLAGARDGGLDMTRLNGPPIHPLQETSAGMGGMSREPILGETQNAATVRSNDPHRGGGMSTLRRIGGCSDGDVELGLHLPKTGDSGDDVDKGPAYDFERSEVTELVTSDQRHIGHPSELKQDKQHQDVTMHIVAGSSVYGCERSEVTELGAMGHRHISHPSAFKYTRDEKDGDGSTNIAPIVTRGTEGSSHLYSPQMLESVSRLMPSLDSRSCAGVEDGRGYRQSLASSQSVPTGLTYSHDSTEGARPEGGTATGRVLLDSLANESRLEVKLSCAEGEIKKLKMTIHQLECDHSEDRKKDRSTVDGLLLRIDEISRSKQNQINERVNECRAKDQVISQLTKTLRDAETAVTMLEQSLESAKRDLAQVQEHSTRKDQALLEIHNSVGGQPVAGAGVAPPTPHTVTDRVQRYIRSQEDYIDGLKEQLQESREMSQGLRDELVVTVGKLSAEHRQRLHQVNEEHSKLMEAATERAMNARKQTLGLQAQLETVEEHSRQELDAKTKEIADLTERLTIQTEQIAAMQRLEQEKGTETEDVIKRTSSELRDKTTQVSRLEEEASLLRTELDKMKESLRVVKTSLEEERGERSRVTELKGQAEIDLSSCQRELEEKTAELERLTERISEEVKQNQERLEAEVNLVKKDSEDRLLQEKSSHEKDISDYQQKLRNLEVKQNQVTSELKKSKERNSSHRKRVGELESRLETVTKERTDIALILEGRERDLLVLRHERDLLENMLEKNRKDSQLESKEKDAIEQSLQEAETKFKKLLSENQGLSSDVDQERKKNVEIQAEKQQLVAVLEKTKTEWEAVKELKKGLGDELDLKEKGLKHLTEELERARSDCSERDSEVKRLQEGNRKLKGNLKELKHKVSELSVERDRSRKGTSEQLARAEREKGLMGSQMKILQRELRTVRGTMKANQAVDDKAKVMAAGMKEDAALHRDLVESLQGEIHWLEECLQGAQKDGEKLLLERNNLQAALQKAEKKIERSQKENQELARRRRDQKGLVQKLEAALEKATIRFGESQQKNERLAQELATLRLHHQLELKELKGNLLNQLTTGFGMPKVKNNSPNQTNTPAEKVEKSPIDVNSTGHIPSSTGEEDLKILLQGILEMMVKEGRHSGKEEALHNRTPPRGSSPSRRNPRKQLSSSRSGDKRQHNRAAITKNSGRVGQTHGDEVPHSLVTTPPATPEKPLQSPSSPVSTLLGYESPPTQIRKQVTGGGPDVRHTVDGGEPSSLHTGYSADPPRDTHENVAKMQGVQEKLSQLVAMGSRLRDRNREIEVFLEDEES